MARDKSTPRILETLPGDVELREPWPEEEAFFRTRPDVAGMAADDNRVVLNPFSPLNESELDAVKLNEAARVFMHRNAEWQPHFELTREQKAAFEDYGKLDDIRATVAARVLSGDPSAMTPTGEQVNFVRRLAEAMDQADRGSKPRRQCGVPSPGAS